VSAMEKQLRDLLIAEAGDPPHRVTVEAVRRRAIRRWAAQAGAASLAVILAVGLCLAVSAGILHFGTPAARGAGEHVGPPRYYVTQYFDAKARKLVMAVRARASGRVTAVIRDPLPGSSCWQGTVGMAAANDQTFFMTCSVWRSAPATRRPGLPRQFRRPGKITSIQSRIYRFQVTSAGRITGYSLVKGSTLNGWADNIAVTADGSEVAAEVITLPRSGRMATNQVPEGIFVINTRTGSRALWHTGPFVPGAVQYVDATNLSFTGDGRDLVVLGPRCRQSRSLIDCNGHSDMQVRAYSPADAGGSLQDGQVLLQDSALKPRGTSLSDAFISPDGSAVTAVLTDCPPHGACTLTVARIPVGAGQQPRVLYQVHSGTRYQGIFERFFSADPSGRYLILDAGAGNARVNGWIDHGRLVPLAPANGNAPDFETW
jgi:hypothetical protein